MTCGVKKRKEEDVIGKNEERKKRDVVTT